MTQEWIEKTLVEFNIKQKDAQVYAFLSQYTSKNAKEIAQELNIPKRQVYRILKKLGHDNFVILTPLFPAQFSAVPFDKVLSMLSASSIEGTNKLESKKTELLDIWKANL